MSEVGVFEEVIMGKSPNRRAIYSIDRVCNYCFPENYYMCNVFDISYVFGMYDQ